MTWFNLDGYGIYVWPVYGLTFLMLGIQGVNAYRHYRRSLKEIKDHV